MHRFSTRLILSALALFCALTLAGRTLADSPGAQITLGPNHSLEITGLAEGGNYGFEYDLQCAQFGNAPCYVFHAGQGMVGMPIEASGCQSQMGNAYTPSAAECDASGVTAVTIYLKNGGQIGIPDVASHPATACSPAPVLIKTGTGANVVTLNNGCHETLDCSLTGSAGMSGGDVDAADTIKGTCTSIIKH
ncbi:MAG: hypothetical protein ACLQPV_08240 [Vulcanimicrobiaceae bacterium]